MQKIIMIKRWKIRNLPFNLLMALSTEEKETDHIELFFLSEFIFFKCATTLVYSTYTYSHVTTFILFHRVYKCYMGTIISSRNANMIITSKAVLEWIIFLHGLDDIVVRWYWIDKALYTPCGIDATITGWNWGKLWKTKKF